MKLVKTIIICQECQMPYHKALWEPTWLAKIAAEPHHEEWHTTFTEPEHSKIVAGWREWERERIIKLLEDTFGTQGIQMQTGGYVFTTDLATIIRKGTK
jgi:hypothetical protein